MSAAPAITVVQVEEDYGTDFYVYLGEKLIRVCPSPGMADAVVASLS